MGGDPHGHGASSSSHGDHHHQHQRPKGWPEHWPADYTGWNNDIWTPYGGPFNNPRKWRRNTAITMLGIVLVCIPIFRVSARLEQRPVPPHFPIPSQMWCKNFGPPLDQDDDDNDNKVS